MIPYVVVLLKEIDRAGYSQLNTMGIVGCEGPTKLGHLARSKVKRIHSR